MQRKQQLASMLTGVMLLGIAAPTLAEIPISESDERAIRGAEVIRLRPFRQKYHDKARTVVASLQQMHAPHAAFGEYAAAKEKYRANPEDPAAKSDYLDAEAHVIDLLSERTHDVMGQHDDFKTAFAAYLREHRQRQADAQTVLATANQKTEANRKHLDTLQENLHRISQRYPEETELPKDVVGLVRRLGLRTRVAKAELQLAEKRQALAKGHVDVLRDEGVAARAMYGELQAAFEQAGSCLLVLKAVAETNRLSDLHDTSSGRIKETVQQGEAVARSARMVSEIIDSFLTPAAPTDTGKAEPLVRNADHAARTILSRYRRAAEVPTIQQADARKEPRQ